MKHETQSQFFKSKELSLLQCLVFSNSKLQKITNRNRKSKAMDIWKSYIFTYHFIKTCRYSITYKITICNKKSKPEKQIHCYCDFMWFPMNFYDAMYFSVISQCLFLPCNSNYELAYSRFRTIVRHMMMMMMGGSDYLALAKTLD